MSETADSFTSKEVQDISGHDVSSKHPPLLQYSKDKQPPLDSADSTMDPPPKDEMTGISQPTTESQSGNNISPEPTTDINRSISQSNAKDESCSNKDEEASTDAAAAPENESSNDDPDPKAPTDTSESETPSPFDDQIVRRAFVRKVFCIVILMLLFTFGVVCLFTFSDGVKKGVRKNIWVFISSFIIFSVVIIILSIYKSYSRRHPWNLVGLAVVTLSLSFMLGTTASYINNISVLIAMGFTITISLAIIAFAAQSRIDFNICFGFILIVTVIVIMCGIFYGILSSCCPSQKMDAVFGGLGAFLLSMFLMVNIQLMMGRSKGRVNPEEYATAALLIYLDIMLVFVSLLDLLKN